MGCSIKKNIDVKLTNVPPLKEVICESIRNLGQYHLNKRTIIFGTVVRTSNINSRELKKDFECKLCSKKFVCESDVTEYNNFATPYRCDT